MTNTTLEWREQPSRDSADCQRGCCKTIYNVCYARYQCRCHQIAVLK